MKMTIKDLYEQVRDGKIVPSPEGFVAKEW